MNNFKICYLGGSNNFVVILAHALAEEEKKIKATGKHIDLVLWDLSIDRAERMAKYARIVAKEMDFDMTVTVTDDRDAAIEGADWINLAMAEWNMIVENRYKASETRDSMQKCYDSLTAKDLEIFKGSEWEDIMKKQFELSNILGDVNCDTAPFCALFSVTFWPYLRKLAKDIRRLAPGSILTVMPSPSDLMAAAVSRAFDITAVGINAEVLCQRSTMAYYLGVEDKDIEVSHIGANHYSWISEWKVKGEDGNKLFLEKFEELKRRPDWAPYFNWLAYTIEKTGYMASNNRFINIAWPADKDPGAEGYCWPILSGVYAQKFYDSLDNALAEGKMIQKSDTPNIRHFVQYEPYHYPQLRYIMGAIVVGYMGAESDYVPIQTRNGKSNLWLPEDAWIETEVKVKNRQLLPQTVKQIPDYVFGQVGDLIQQRLHITDWLIGKDPDGLKKADSMWLHEPEIERLLKFEKAAQSYLDSILDD